MDSRDCARKGLAFADDAWKIIGLSVLALLLMEGAWQACRIPHRR